MPSALCPLPSLLRMGVDVMYAVAASLGSESLEYGCTSKGRLYIGSHNFG